MADRHWVGGTGSWTGANTANWSATLGGASGASVPTSSDNAIFDSGSAGANYTVTMNGNQPCLGLTIGAPSSGTLTFAGTGGPNISGSMSVAASGVSMTATGSFTFVATAGGNTIATNGVALANAIVFNGASGGWALSDAPTTTGAVTLTQGALDLAGFTFTAKTFAHNSGGLTKSVAFSGGKIVLTGNNATVLSVSGLNTSHTGTPRVELSYAGSVGTRTLSGTASMTEANTYDVYILGGTDALTLTAFTHSLNFTGYAGALAAGARTVYGSLTFAAGMTVTGGASTTTLASTGSATINPAGITTGINFTINGIGATYTLADSIAGALQLTLTNGALDLAGFTVTTGIFNSSNANARSVTFNGGKFVLTGNATTIYNTATDTNLTFTGTPRFECTYSGAAGTRTINGGSFAAQSPNVYVTAGSDAVSPVGVTVLDFTGFTGTLATGGRNIFGDLTLGTGMTVTATNSVTTFAAPSGTQTITTNGVTADIAITINAPSATVKQVGAITQTEPRAFTLTAGTFDMNGYGMTVGRFSSSGATARTLAMGAMTLSLLGGSTSTFVWDTSTATNFAITYSGAAKIATSGATATNKVLKGGGYTGFPVLDNTSAALTITGSNSFADITNSASPTGFVFTAGTTQTVAAFTASGAASNLVTITSTAPGTPATLSKASGTVTASYLDIADSTATGGATWDADIARGNVDHGGNSGWVFGVVAPPPTGGSFSLGTYPRRRTKEEVDAERVRLGIIPKPIQRTVTSVVDKTVHDAPKGKDQLELLAEQETAIRQALIDDLAAQQIAYDERYMQLLALHMALYAQRQEEEEILFLLMEF